MVTRPISRLPSKTVWSAGLGLIIVVLSFAGALDGVVYWLRGIIQSVGSVAGILAGWALQERTSEIRQQGAVRAASAGLIALAETLNVGVAFVSESRLRISQGDHRQIASLQQIADATLSGVESHLTGSLKQVRSALEAWRAVDQVVVDEQLTRHNSVV